MDEANAKEDVSNRQRLSVGDEGSVGRGSAADKTLNPVPRISSKEADRDRPEIETDAESRMHGNVDDAGYARARRPRRGRTTVQQGARSRTPVWR